MWKDEYQLLRWPDGPTQTVWRQRLKWFGAFLFACLTPSFETPAKENKVAYLDGVRGFAAFLVYCIHYTAFTHPLPERRLNHSYGFLGEYYFANLPGVHLFFNGGAFAVAVFFVISGYVLSVSPLNMIHRQRPGDALRLCVQLGCSFPRRWIRLYLPAIATTFIFMTTCRVPPEETYAKEFVRWFDGVRQGSYFYLQSEVPGFSFDSYNHHIWSIATEYRGSLVIYVTTLVYFALGYKTNVRVCACLGLFFYFLIVVDSPYFALFVMGMVLCDIDLASELNPHQLHRILKFELLQKYRWINYLLLCIGIYLGGAPLISQSDILPLEPGWALLAYTVPYTISDCRWYFPVYGALIFIFCIPRIAWLRRMFESSLFQFLGKVSFGFYLVHGPIIWTVGDRLYAAVGRPGVRAADTVPGWTNIFPISDIGPLGFELNVLLPQIILLPLTLWLAVVVTKMIDGPSLRLSKWLFAPSKQNSSELEAESKLNETLPTYTDEIQR